MNFTEFAFRRPITLLMVFLSLTLFGGAATGLIPLAFFPDLTFPGILIEVPYPGASPESVEREITRPIEEVLSTMPGIERMRSTSSESGAFVFVFFGWDSDMDIKGIEAREKIDAIWDQMPSDARDYFVRGFATSDEQMITFRLSSDRDLSTTYTLLDRRLKRRMERIEGVSKVELYGVEQPEIRVQLKADRITAHRVNIGELSNLLQRSNFSTTAGEISDAGMRFTVRPVGEFNSIDDLNNLIIKPNLRLSDIANVTFDQRERDYGRHLDGNYAVGLNVFKASGANVVEVTDRVMLELEEIGLDPQMSGIEIITFENQAEGIISSINDLLSSGLLGGLFSLIILFFFLRRVSETLIVSLAVPFSIMVTIGMMYMLGMTLNILSMMGLMLAIGMLVDNAVVVTESIHQYQLRGFSPKEAALKGTKEVSMAVIAGTITTACVFLPIIVSPANQLTVFLREVGITICIALAASLLISQTVVPLLASRLKSGASKTKESKSIKKLGEFYERVLAWTLNRPRISFLIILATLITAPLLMAFELVPVDFDDEDAGRDMWMSYHVTGVYTLEKVEALVTSYEEYLFAHKEELEIESVYSYFEAGEATTGIWLTEDEDKMIKTPEEIQELIIAGLPESPLAQPSFSWRDNGGAGGASQPIRVALNGESTQELIVLSERMAQILNSVSGLKNARTEAAADRQEILVGVNRERAGQVGLSSQNVAQTVSTVMRGQNLRRFRTDDGEVEVRLEFQDRDRQNLAQLQNIPLTLNNGQQVSLSSLAEFNSVASAREISRDNRTTTIGVTAILDEITTEQAAERIEAALSGFEMPPGYSWSLSGRFEDDDETMDIMFLNFGIALCLIYFVMAGLFESIMLPASIWTSILFAIVGVIWFFAITQTTFGIMAFIGILILVGIVVNNGIVMLDHANHLRETGLERTAALLQAGKDRMRPIIMTSGTTILGLIPLCMPGIQIGGGGPSYFPMARAIVGGLLFATVFTLVFLPSIYTYFDNLRIWSVKIRK